MTRTRILAIGLACVLVSMATPDAHAVIVAYDPFDYTPVGSTLITTTNTGTGFADAWHAGAFNANISNNYAIAAGSLGFGNLSTTANSTSATAQSALSGVTRDFSTTLGAAGTTDYFSVLLRPDGTITGGTFSNFYGLYLNSSLGNQVFFGKPGNGPIGDYDVETRGGTMQYDSGVAAVTGQTVLLVLRADFTSGVDKFTLYVNPTPGGTEPITGTVKADVDIGNVTGLSFYSTGAFTADEVRVGTTYADVTVTPAAVPEPSAYLLLAVGGLGMIGASRLRRRFAKTPA